MKKLASECSKLDEELHEIQTGKYELNDLNDTNDLQTILGIKAFKYGWNRKNKERNKEREKKKLIERNERTKQQMDLEKKKYAEEREQLQKQISSVTKRSEGTIFSILSFLRI